MRTQRSTAQRAEESVESGERAERARHASELAHTKAPLQDPIETPRTSPRPGSTEAAHTAAAQHAHRAARCARSTAFTHGSREGGDLGTSWSDAGATGAAHSVSPGRCERLRTARDRKRHAALDQGGWARGGSATRRQTAAKATRKERTSMRGLQVWWIRDEKASWMCTKNPH